MAASPYGFWTSPITSDLVVGDLHPPRTGRAGRRRNLLERDSSRRSRDELSSTASARMGEPERVTPDDAFNALSVRTRAHEYGGGSFAVSDGVVLCSRTIAIRGSIARTQAGRRARSRRLQPAPLRMRCDTPMAS